MLKQYVTKLPHIIWIVPLCVALIESISFFTMQVRLVDQADLRKMAQWLRVHHQERDQIISAPAWMDPLVRQAVGNLIDVQDASAVDLEPYDRLWVVSSRGHRAELAPRRRPDFIKRFGRVRLERWDLGPSAVIYNLTEHVMDAEVQMIQGGMSTPCRIVTNAPKNQGLGAGPSWPRQRILCDSQRPWIFVGPTVNEDLDLRLRRCVWHHPSGPEPIQVLFRQVPLGERIIVDADTYYMNERERNDGSFTLRVRVNGRIIASMMHHDGEGRKRIEGQTQPIGSSLTELGDVTFEVMANNPHTQTVCWSALIEGPPRILEPN